MMQRLFSLLLLLIAAAAAQVIPGRYMVELQTEPVLEMLARSPRNVSREAIAERRVAIAAEQSRVSSEMTRAGMRVLHSIDTAANVVTVSGSAADAGRIAKMSGVRAVHPVYKVHADLDRAQVIHKVAEAWQAAGGQERAGEGMKIAIIDSGIDPTHAGLQDSSLAVPAGYPKSRSAVDQPVLNNKIIVARSYDDLYDARVIRSASDCYGHGTGTAFTAAGAPVQANYARVSGVAPKAFLGAYRVFEGCTGGGATDVVLRGINDAIDDGMDVINLSLGSTIYDRNTDTIYNSVFSRAAAAGIVVVASAGNSGPDPLTIGAPGNATNVISVGAIQNDRTFRFAVSVDGLQTMYGQPGSGPNTADVISGQIIDVATFDQNGLGCNGFPAGSLTGRIALIRRGLCNFEVKINFAASAGASAVLVANNVDDPIIPMSVASATLPAIMVSRVDGDSIRAALAQNAGINASLGFNGELVPQDFHQVSSFSSHGPSVTGGFALKPDLVAVGGNVYTAASTNPQAEIFDGSGFLLLDGTSYSAPMVSGAAAVLKKARSGLTAEQYRSLLVNSASALASTAGAEFPPVEAGAGILNLDAAMRNTIALSTTTLSFDIVGGGAIDVSRDITVYNIGTAAEVVNIEVLPRDSFMGPALSKTVLEIPAGGSAVFTARMQGTEIPGGTYQGIIRLRGANSASELRLPYWMARPTGVPDTVTILDVFPEFPTPGAIVEIDLRVLDSATIPLNWSVQASAVTSEVEIISFENVDSDVPGLWVLKLRLARRPSDNRFSVQIFDFRREYSISTL